MHIYDLPNDILHLILSTFTSQTAPITSLSPANPDCGFAFSPVASDNFTTTSSNNTSGFRKSSSTAALYALTRTCKLFNSHSTPHLYRHVTLRRGATHDAATHAALLALTSPASRLPSYIREIRFKGWGTAARGFWMANAYDDALCVLAAHGVTLAGKMRLRDVYWEDHPNPAIFSALSEVKVEGKEPVRLHVRAQRVADSWGPFWPYVFVCCENLNSLTLLRYTGHEADLKDVLVRCANLEHFEIKRARRGGESLGLLPLNDTGLPREDGKQMPRLKTLRYFNGLLHVEELEDWATSGGFDALEVLATNCEPLMRCVLDAGVQKLQVLDVDYARAEQPSWLELIRQQTALRHLRINAQTLDIMAAFRDHALVCPHLFSLSSRARSVVLEWLHLGDKRRVSSDIISDTAYFPSLSHAAVDLHIDLWEKWGREPEQLKNLGIPLASHITHLTLYISPRLQPGILDMFASREKRRDFFDSLTEARDGPPLAELTLRIGAEELGEHGLSLDQLQAVWSQNDQSVYVLRPDGVGSVDEQKLDFEDVWGICDTMPNNYVVPALLFDEQSNAARSVYDKLCDKPDP